MKIVTGKKEFFPGVGKINYEGTQSDNPLAYRWYDENKLVAGRPMKGHLRFACAYWHSFCGSGADPFGEPTHGRQEYMKILLTGLFKDRIEIAEMLANYFTAQKLS
jgi:xylose isomerase